MGTYTAIPSKEYDVEDSSDSIDSASRSGIASDSASMRLSAVGWFPWCLHLLIFVLSISAGLLVQPASRCSSVKDELLGEHPWDLTVRFDGSLSRDSSPFKGPPSEKVDQLWEDLVPQRKMIISEDVFQTINASKHSVKAPPSLGKGRLAAFEGFHYIHCLHNLWKTHYPQYYTEEAKFAREHRDEWLEHVDHCVEILRQKLVCDADAGLITYSWLKNHYNPHPNFNVQHQCRNYNRLLEASAKYGVGMEVLPKDGIRRPEDEKVVDYLEPPFNPLAED